MQETSQHVLYLGSKALGNSPRDMTPHEVIDNRRDVSTTQLTDMLGLYELGCFKRRSRSSCHDIIDARWVNPWNLT